jgi:hypothetical protein
MSSLAQPCQEQPTQALIRGVELFNRGAFYSCHNVLEDHWRDETGPLRDLYQGLIQVAVALYHESRGNRRGAEKLLVKAREKLAPYAPACLGLDVAGLFEAMDAIEAHFAASQAQLPAGLVPRLELKP